MRDPLKLNLALARLNALIIASFREPRPPARAAKYGGENATRTVTGPQETKALTGGET